MLRHVPRCAPYADLALWTRRYASRAESARQGEEPFTHDSIGPCFSCGRGFHVLINEIAPRPIFAACQTVAPPAHWNPAVVPREWCRGAPDEHILYLCYSTAMQEQQEVYKREGAWRRIGALCRRPRGTAGAPDWPDSSLSSCVGTCTGAECASIHRFKGGERDHACCKRCMPVARALRRSTVHVRLGAARSGRS